MVNVDPKSTAGFPHLFHLCSVARSDVNVMPLPSQYFHILQQRVDPLPLGVAASAVLIRSFFHLARERSRWLFTLWFV